MLPAAQPGQCGAAPEIDLVRAACHFPHEALGRHDIARDLLRRRCLPMARLPFDETAKASMAEHREASSFARTRPAIASLLREMTVHGGEPGDPWSAEPKRRNVIKPMLARDLRRCVEPARALGLLPLRALAETRLAQSGHTAKQLAAAMVVVVAETSDLCRLEAGLGAFAYSVDSATRRHAISHPIRLPLGPQMCVRTEPPQC